MIEKAYQIGAKLELAVWVQDEAGPYQTKPYPGESWQPEGHPVHQPHEYIRNGTAKMLTLFHPVTGQLRVKGVTHSTSAVLHPWVKEQVFEILKGLPEKPPLDEATNRLLWTVWQKGLSRRITLPEKLPPLRMLLIWDNLIGHKTPELVLWLFAHGVMLLYTPLCGSWLNMAESIQRIIIRRHWKGRTQKRRNKSLPGWRLSPAFGITIQHFEWGGARAARRERSRNRRHALGCSGAFVRRPIRQKVNLIQKWHSACQLTQ